MSPSHDAHGALRKLGEFTMSSVAVTVLRFPVRLVKSILFVRLLGPGSMGVYRLFLTVPSLIVSFGNMGYGLGAIYLVAKRKCDLRRVLGNSLAYVLLYGAIIAGIGMAVLRRTGQTMAGGAEGLGPYAAYVFAAVPLLLALNVGLNLLMGIKSIHLMNALDLALSLLPVALLVLLWRASGDALLASIWSWIAPTAAVAAVAFLRVRSAAGGGMPGFSLPYLRDAFSFGLRGNLSNFASEVVRKVDVLFVAHYAGVAAVGYYAVSVAIAELLLAVPDTVAGPFMPLRFEMEKSEGHSFSALVLRIVLAVMALACCATAVLGKLIVLVLYGAEFLPALRAMQLLLPGMLALSIYQFLRADIYSLDRPGFVSWVALATMLCNLALNFLLIPPYGIAGAAASSSISYTLSTVVLLVFFTRHSGLRMSEVLFLRGQDVRLLLRVARSYLGGGTRGGADGRRDAA
jgi:O-antigen/teichoic acid export membrane protein